MTGSTIEFEGVKSRHQHIILIEFDLASAFESTMLWEAAEVMLRDHGRQISGSWYHSLADMRDVFESLLINADDPKSPKREIDARDLHDGIVRVKLMLGAEDDPWSVEERFVEVVLNDVEALLDSLLEPTTEEKMTAGADW